jgi:ABC-type transport system substrate-binding protein
MQVRGYNGAAEYGVYTSEQISSPANRWGGQNRGGWTNATYDRWFETFTTSLAGTDRINSMAQMEKILTEEVPVVFHYFGAEVNAHVAGLQGPVARPAPNTSGAFLYVHTWEWRS